jgi:hypothetical protein
MKKIVDAVVLDPALAVEAPWGKEWRNLRVVVSMHRNVLDRS